MLHTTLAIESTCDDTSVALVTRHDGFFHVHRMLTYSQTIHSSFGGVVPEYASRDHAKWLPLIVDCFGLNRFEGVVSSDLSLSELPDGVRGYRGDEETGKEHGLFHGDRLQIDSISVATHPGLFGSLVSGITTGYFLSSFYALPLHEVNHIVGHVFSVLCDRELSSLSFPALCLTVSGGHSDVYLIEERQAVVSEESKIVWHKPWHLALGEELQVGSFCVKKLYQTMDDAVWEAFDKVSTMLWWPSPGWLWIDTMAKEGVADELIASHLRPLSKTEQFSFSWIKSQVANFLRYVEKESLSLDEQMKKNIAWQFQERVTDAMIRRLSEAVEEYQPAMVTVVWGVSANSVLRQKVRDRAVDLWLSWWLLLPSSLRYCVDNAAMIAIPALVSL